MVGEIKMSKWYDGAVSKEKIIYMFNGDFPLSDICIESIAIYEKIVVCSFITNYIPSKYPEKWKLENFNAISFELSFSDLIDFSFNGDHLFGNYGELIIQKKDDVIHINFKSSNIDLSFTANYMFINDIKPINMISSR